MEKTKIDRIEYLDVAKAFAILCVIIGHLVSWNGAPSVIYDTIYSFHMPLFMTVSGYFLGKSLEQPFTVFLSRRFVQLIIPTISFTLIFYVLKGGYTEGDMWFLKFLFADLMVAYVSKKIFRITWVAALVPTILLFCLTRIGIYRMLPYLWLGYYLNKKSDFIGSHLLLLLSFSWGCFAALLSVWKGDYIGTRRFVFLNDGISVDNMAAYSTIIQLAIGTVGSVAFILLFRFLWKGNAKRAVSQYVVKSGRNTLGIYCLQIYFIEHLLGCVQYPPGLYPSLAAVLLAFPFYYVLNGMVNFIDRNRLSSFLLLGRTKKADTSVFQDILYYVVYSFMYCLSLFPLRLLYCVSDFIYLILYKMVGYRVRLVRKSLRDSFPQKSETELRQIERGFYHWFCDYIVETIKLFSISESEMKRRMHFENPEEMNNSMSKGQSVTLYLGHYCNWEWVSSLGIYVGKEFIGAQIYHELENRVFDRLLLVARGRFGVRSIEMKESFATLVSWTHQGKFHTTGYISDQVPGYSGMHYWPTFLNHPLTPVYSGAERVARALNTACFYIDIQRKKRGYYTARFVKMCDTADELPKFEITGLYFRLLENSIRRQPHLWLWTHNRWKRTWEDFCQCYPDTKKREVILRKL